MAAGKRGDPGKFIALSLLGAGISLIGVGIALRNGRDQGRSVAAQAGIGGYGASD
jgi:hypothetical protein